MCSFVQLDWRLENLFLENPSVNVTTSSPGPLVPFLAPWSSALPVPAVLDTRDVAAALLAVRAAAPGPGKH